MTLVPQHIILQSPASNDPLLDLNTQPSLDLQFATGKTLDDRVSGLPLVNHQRDASSGKSAGTYVGSDGLIKTSAVNLATYSEDLTQRTILDVTTPTAALLQATAQSGSQTPYAAINVFTFPETNTAYTVYADFEKVSIRYAIINFQLFSTNGLCIYDLDTGTVSNQPAGFTCSMTDSGGGIYRCTATLTTGADVTGRVSFGMSQLSTIHRVTDPTTADQIIIHRIQIQKGSTASTYVPTTNLQSGEPRFDHAPVTGESLGLLIEESRTNLMLNSGTTAEMVASSQTTRTSGGFAAPDGSTDASRVDLPAVTGANIVEIITEQLTSLSASTNHTASIYLKGVNGGELVYLTFEPGTPTSSVVANLTTEWQRFDITRRSSAGGLLYFNIGVDTRSGTGQTNQPAQSFFVWGAQLEVGSFPTSYIPTTSSAVTRAADLASITGTNFSSWYNQSEGTVYSEFDWNLNNQSNITFPWYIRYDGDSGNSVYLGNWGSTTQQSLGVRFNNPGITSQLSIPGSTPGVSHKYATTLNAFDFAVALDGGVIGTYTGEDLATSMTSLRIGGYIGTYVINGHISRLAYYPYRLADATLQEITS